VTRETITVEPGPRNLVVQVLMCARCGSERTVYLHGHRSVDPHAPVVLGHELVGRIVHVGREVHTLREGIGFRDGQTLPEAYLDFRVGERVCVQSRIARYRNGLMLIAAPLANIAFQTNGGFAQYMEVPEAVIRSQSVFRVPENVTDEEACLVEPAACALESIYGTPHAVGVDESGRHVFRSGILPGGSVCIIGSGTVSMIYARLAVLEGAGRVVMVVRSEAKRRLVRRLLGGTVETYLAPRLPEDASPETLAAEEDIVRDLTELTDGYLFDDVVCACSSPAAQRLMLKLYTPEGYAAGACFGGTHRLVDAAELDTNHYRAAVTTGSSGCSNRAMMTVLEWLASDRLDLRGFTAPRHFTLEDDPHEFFTTDAGGLKPVLYPNEGVGRTGTN